MSRFIRCSGFIKGKYIYKFICLPLCEEERKKKLKINLEEKMNNIIYCETCLKLGTKFYL